MQNRIMIIAEAGVNHNGDLNLAKELIRVASDADADFVKFQTFSADRIVTRSALKAEYQLHSSSIHESQYQMLRRLELRPELHLTLIDHCALHKIKFLSSGFDIDSLDLLASLGMDRFKIPSGEITNLPYLRHVGRFGKPVILSTGMASLGEIEAAIEVLEEAGTSRSNVTILHCTTEYPTPMVDVNLRAMQSIKAAFDVSVGYSDHTEGIEVAIAAAALGASIIEKHFTLDRNLPGPDHQASLQPDELKAMVSAIRHIEQALGSGIKQISPSELKNKRIARKSIVTIQPIKAGEVFSVENVTAKRPGTGISPMRWDEVIGKKAPRDFGEDELIEL